MYAEIIIDIIHEKVDKPFLYKIPENFQQELVEGMCVQVPFGQGNTIRSGFVIGITPLCSYPPEKMKSIVSIENRLPLESDFMKLAFWMQSYYGGTLSGALKTVLTSTKKENPKSKKIIHFIGSDELVEKVTKEFRKKNAKAKLRLLEAIKECVEIESSLLLAKLNLTMATVRSLEQLELIEVVEEREYRNPYFSQKTNEKFTPELNDEQQKAVDFIWTQYEHQQKNTYLLHGVTGSGKTEVYMEVIAKVITQGKQAIVLIPEIALTFQTVTRFIRRFGNRVSVLHSKLSKGERSDQLERARKGEIDIMIGPRSALFTPFTNLGLIVIDEEHETSYKSEKEPKYHARETAIFRGQQCGASVVLASATPSIESYYKAESGEYQLLELKDRFGSRDLAQVEVVDLRDELKRGNRSVFSDRLMELMEERLEKKQQIMLFMNRRGVAGFISCRSCGTVIQCPHCAISLTVHRGGVMKCHYCGYTMKQPESCPSCGSKYIGGFKAGTQKIEELVQKKFPQARILRMDADTTVNKHSYDDILSKFANEEADILVGTQMIVKGHDFKKVTLVGVLAADISLFSGDYHGSERTFQLLTQAAGRAGRGEDPGKVIIQTYQPDHFSILAAQQQNYEEFYRKEITYRKLLRYPPVSNFFVVLILSPKEKLANECLEVLSEYAKSCQKEIPGFSLVGKGEASIEKIQDVYRKVIYCRHADYNILIKIKDIMKQKYEQQFQSKEVVIQFDFNPMNNY